MRYFWSTDDKGVTTVEMVFVSTENVSNVDLIYCVVTDLDVHVDGGEVTDVRAWQDGYAVPVDVPVRVLCADELY